LKEFGNKKMILIDLEKCYKCKECIAKCNYAFHPYKTGVKLLIEEAIRKIVCRHCEDAPCVASCPQEALKRDGKELKRASFLCTSCKTCILACPFGVNTLETVEFKVSICDYCTNREPLCVKTCDKGAIEVGEFTEDETKDLYKVKEGLFAKAVPWWKQLGTNKELIAK
jgi:Fe-S-cluster-containing dehydrogenase component